MRLPDLLRLQKRRKLARKGFTQTRKIRRTEPVPRQDGQSPFRAALAPVLTLVIVWLVATFSTVCRRPYSTFHCDVGQKANRYVYSEVPFEYEDKIQTERKRQQARQQVPHVYGIDQAAIDTSLKLLDQLQRLIVDRMAKVVPADDAEDAPDTDGRVKQLVDQLDPAFLPVLERLFDGPPAVKLLRDAVKVQLNKGIASADDIDSLGASQSGVDRISIIYERDKLSRKTLVPVGQLTTPAEAAAAVATALEQFPGSKTEREQALVAVLQKVLLPNLEYDFAATQRQQERSAEEVQPVTKIVHADTILLRQHEVVTEADIGRLRGHQEALHRRGRSLREDPWELISFASICLVVVLAGAYCLYLANPELVRRVSSVSLLGLIIVIQILLARGVANIYYGYRMSSFFLFPLLPLSLGSMLLAPLLGLRSAVWAGILTSAIAGLQQDQSHALQLCVMGATSSLVATLLMQRARKRLHALRAGVGVAITAFLVHSLFPCQAEIPVGVLPRIFGLACLNGFGCAILATAVLPFFEYVFGITTEASLLELSDLNHPLLKRLQLEAPGTYHHSLMVATLAEQAAEAIGANPLLTRVCAYFHDIGKLSYPEYFTENARGDDPHEELQPRMSSLVILNHVKEGIDLALKYKLRRPIREAISQHHGTNLVYYFYRRALEQKDGTGEETQIGEQDYRYPGPLPQRKEITLVSLADSCEAAVRSLEKPTPQKITALVNEIVQKRIRDRQLECADLTLAELAIAKETIAKALGMMLHGRVRYPKQYDDEVDLFKAAAKTPAKGPAAPPEGDSSRDADERTGRDT